MSILFSKRSAAGEIMDDLEFHDDVVFQTLVELDTINRWLGGNTVTWRGLEKLWKSIPKEQRITIADLGCGSGEMLRLISKKARHQNRNVDLTGVDANPHIVDYARNHSVGFSTIHFESLNVLSDEFNALHFDVIITTLFLHHFSEEELIKLLISLKKQARIGIIVNDIHRHPLAYYSIKWLTSLFSRSAMVKYDAPLSVLRAFKRGEIETTLAKAGIKDYELKWRWAFRWQLVIRC